MKKLVSFVIAATMVAAMCTTAYAADETLTNGSKRIDVEAKYEGATSTPAVYSVDVSWGAMQFTYSASGTMDWDAASHTYVDNTDAGWSAEGNTVTVTNHSNAEITAAFSFLALDAYETIMGSFDVESVTLPSAENKAVDAAELSETASLMLDGTLDSSITDFTKVGVITVTIE